LRELDCQNHQKDRKQIQNKCRSTTQEPSSQNTTGRNTKPLKILHIICIQSIRRNQSVQTDIFLLLQSTPEGEQYVNVLVVHGMKGEVIHQ
jgi:hypothetical protein